VGGGQAVQSIKLRPEWQKIIDDARLFQHPNKRRWTKEEDAFIVEARMANPKVEWSVICKELGCDDKTARKRFVELRGRGND
jgi:hypothetical protein